MHRAPERITAYDLRDPALAATDPDGYFQGAIFNERFGAANGGERPPRNILLMLDTSLSMSGEKLARGRSA